MKSIQDILNSGINYLNERGIDEARHSMQSLLVHVLGCNKTWIYLHFNDPIDQSKLPELRDLLRQRGQGVPLQHLLGSVEFYRREFRSDGRALIPRPETEELVELALKLVKPQEGMRILDMGTGSGIIGISLALELANQRPEVVMVDISEAALSLALDNASQLAARVKTYQSDLFSLWKSAEEEGSSAISPPSNYKLVLANLPYVPDGEPAQIELAHDPSNALYGGADGLDIVRRFLADALPYLDSEALVMLEVGHDQGERSCRIMEELGYQNCQALCDINGHARFPMGYAAYKEPPSKAEEGDSPAE